MNEKMHKHFPGNKRFYSLLTFGLPDFRTFGLANLTSIFSDHISTFLRDHDHGRICIA